MPGTNNMLMGAAFCIGGAILTAITIALSGGTFVIAFWGAILFGGAQFIWGLIQWLGYKFKSKEAKEVHHLKVDVKVVLRSMIAVAAADGRLDEGEIIIINDFSRSLLGQELGSENIRETFDGLVGKDYIEELADIAKQTTQFGSELAVKGAILVARSDGNFDEIEATLIAKIAGTLGVTGERLKATANEAHELYNTLISNQNAS